MTRLIYDLSTPCFNQNSLAGGHCSFICAIIIQASTHHLCKMLALLAILPVLAGAQTVYSRITAEANFPTSSNGGTKFETGTNTAWATTNSSVDLAGGLVGWRIAGDASSEVLYNVGLPHLKITECVQLTNHAQVYSK
ncbi:hypothetical protein FIBSPDRAFT_184554 [Athelia psychrophila]|uniref:Uncharacterized protein n=1 Tax=Athelia psychrophila TaxID=1759441 RepID=A0A166AG67_9AGAM|nr:hypothetical protein FIBSPDRAFT_184554 [Fibularhizoctonia sp. CBS 109695]